MFIVMVKIIVFVDVDFEEIRRFVEFEVVKF